VRLAEDNGPAGFRLEVEVNVSYDNWAALSEGAYLLRSNTNDWRDNRLWKAYIQLTQAEAAFRIQKANSRCAPSGASAPIVSRPTSSFAFWLSYCGRPWRCGRAVQVSETLQQLFWKNLRAFNRTT
jgi:hypothetical protein